MPFNGSGVYTPVGSPDYPAVPGQTIKADQYNHALEDFAAGLTNAITRDGQSPPTANLPMGGNKITGLAAGTASGDAVHFGQTANQSTAGLAVVGTETNWQDPSYNGTGNNTNAVPGVQSFRSIRAFGSNFSTRERNTPAMSVQTTAGVYAKRSGGFAVQAQQISVIAASDPTNPRIDVVVMRTDAGFEGVVNVLTGTPAASPVAPDIGADRMPIAMVTVPANATVIRDANITDLRGIPKSPGFSTDSTQVAQTGDVVYKFRTTAPTGWVAANGTTIGNAVSGATGRANADTTDLYALIWGATDNTTYHIQDSAGTPTTRGASAAADFAANKRLPLPDLRATVIRGLDNGRGVDAGRLFGSEQAPYTGDHKHFEFNVDAPATGTTITNAQQATQSKNNGSSSSDYIIQGTSTAATLGLTSNPTTGGPGETVPRNTALPAYIKL